MANAKLVLANLAERYGEQLRRVAELKPTTILEVTRDYGNPHQHPYVPNLRTSLAVVVEVQPVFVRIRTNAHGIETVEAMPLEDRVLLIVDGRPEQHLLSAFDTWKVYKSDAPATGV